MWTRLGGPATDHRPSLGSCGRHMSTCAASRGPPTTFPHEKTRLREETGFYSVSPNIQWADCNPLGLVATTAAGPTGRATTRSGMTRTRGATRLGTPGRLARVATGSRLATLGLTLVATPLRRTGLLDAHVGSFVTHGVNGTTELTSNPGSLVIPIVLAQERQFLSAPDVSAVGSATGAASDLMTGRRTTSSGLGLSSHFILLV